MLEKQHKRRAANLTQKQLICDSAVNIFAQFSRGYILYLQIFRVQDCIRANRTDSCDAQGRPYQRDSSSMEKLMRVPLSSMMYFPRTAALECSLSWNLFKHVR